MPVLLFFVGPIQTRLYEQREDTALAAIIGPGDEAHVFNTHYADQ